MKDISFCQEDTNERTDKYKCYLESSRIFICTGYYGSRSNEGEIVPRKILERGDIHTGNLGREG